MSQRTGQLTLLLFALVSASALAKPGKDWPLYRGDSLSSGVAQTTLPDKPELLWKYEVKGGAFESTATIAGGVVYIGGMDGTLFALDLASGKEVWGQQCG